MSDAIVYVGHHPVPLDVPVYNDVRLGKPRDENPHRLFLPINNPREEGRIVD